MMLLHVCWCASLLVDDAPSLSVALKGAPFVTFLVTYVQLLLVLQTSVCNPLSDCTSNFNIKISLVILQSDKGPKAFLFLVHYFPIAKMHALQKEKWWMADNISFSNKVQYTGYHCTVGHEGELYDKTKFFEYPKIAFKYSVVPI